MRVFAWNEYAQKALAGELLSRKEAQHVLEASPSDTPALIAFRPTTCVDIILATACV